MLHAWRVGDHGETRVLLRKVTVVIRVMTAVIEICEEADTHNRRKRNESSYERERYEKRERRSKRPAECTFAHDRGESLFPCAVLLAPRVELVEDRLPLLSCGFLGPVEVVE